MRTFLSTSIPDALWLEACTCQAFHLGLILILGFGVTAVGSAADVSGTFNSPEEAVSALSAAANHPDNGSLRNLFGIAADELLATDEVQSKRELTNFTTALSAAHQIVHESETKCVLEVGPERWPFPVPIVLKAGHWSFDTDAGRNELINRRIGRNELSTLEALRAGVQAQREYASRDRNGDGILEFAQKFLSSPGRKDGLFWDPELDGTVSPLGPLIAYAQNQGYSGSNDNQHAPRPFHGYYFKILTRQGRHASGGKYNYIINGHMIGGFALVAWPADYGESGVMTFIVNQQGRIYQKDLGAETGKVAAAMKSYDPDSTWRLSPE